LPHSWGITGQFSHGAGGSGVANNWLVRVLVFRGRVQAMSSHGKTYVRIYVYADYGGGELAKYVGREVEGLLVVKDEDEEGDTHQATEGQV